jgi:pectinesterase
MTHPLRWTAATAVTVAAATLVPLPAAGPSATITVKNPSAIDRPSETIAVSGADLAKVVTLDDLRKVLVRDTRAGQDVLVQAVDLDDDAKFDEIVFQAHLAANETRSFTVSVGERRIAKYDDYKVYGRFMRERRDDFAWENDRVAHRMYGEALESWAHEPLTSSTVDVWCKKTPRLVVNNWYLVDDYHRDLGDGADFYSAGKSRGIGGNAPWVGGRLWPSSNFRHSRVIANGPIRLIFELTYAPWNVNGQAVSEIKRVTLDAGQHFNRFESRFRSAAPLPPQVGIGIKKAKQAAVDGAKDLGWITSWEPVAGENNGNLALAVVLPDPAAIAEVTEDELNRLVVIPLPKDGVTLHYAGSAWDKAGQITDQAAWRRYVEAFAVRVRQPVVVSVSGGAGPSAGQVE